METISGKSEQPAALAADTSAARLPSKIDFLADYASWLWGVGATCIRTEKNTARIAEALGMDVDLTIMPKHIEVTSKKEDGERQSTVVSRRPSRYVISFDINTRLSRLSWEIADNKIDYEEAVKRFREITATPPTNRWETLIAASMANASFCRLFGGDITAMAVVFIATFAGFSLKQIMVADKRDIRLVFLCCAFFSASLSAGAHIFHLGQTPGIALGTSVLYLIPGVPYINAVSDLLASHYICAFARFIDALVLTVCLSLGLCGGMYILGLSWF